MIDANPERKWIYEKANKLKMKIILPQKTNFQPISCPKEFTADLQNLNLSDGWSKNLANLPSLTLDKILAYVERELIRLLLQNRRKKRNTSNEDSNFQQKTLLIWTPFYLNKMINILVLKVFVLQV